MTHQNHRALSNLLGGYFHQDWLEEFPDVEAALEAMRNAETSEEIRAAVADASSIVASQRSDADVDALLQGELGCCFDPASRSLTSRAWLTWVRDMLSGAL